MNGNGNNNVTPASFAFSRATAPKVVAENKEIVRNLLDKEASIYQLVFQLAAALTRIEPTEDIMLTIFVLVAVQKMIGNATADQVRPRRGPGFSTYTSVPRP